VLRIIIHKIAADLPPAPMKKTAQKREVSPAGLYQAGS
jgi:hypothetical protein